MTDFLPILWLLLIRLLVLETALMAVLGLHQGFVACRHAAPFPHSVGFCIAVGYLW